MTIDELHQNEELRRTEFPVVRDKIFLAHAGVCPLPRRVAHAVSNYADLCTHGDQETLGPALQIQATRTLAAQLLRASADEIAFVGPTSLALSFVAAGLPFGKNDHVLVYFDDYPANVYPWMALADRGVEVRFLNIPELGRIRLKDVSGQIDENTRLVALASCHFIAGYRLDVAAIGEMLRRRNVFFCVDAIQTLGAFPISVEHVDFLAADAHKWLLGPCGAGILYVRKSLQEILKPTTYGWHNIRCPNFVAQEEIVFRPDARRYEPGTHNLLGLVGLHAALELLQEVGIDAISAELIRKRNWLVPALQKKGFSVLQSQAPPEAASSIIAFSRSGTDIHGLYQHLDANGVVASLRTDRAGQRYLRLSPHFYNTDAELHRALELIC